MAKRLAELGALQDAVSNSESNPSRLGLAGYIRGLFLDWSANPYNPLTRLSARGRLLGYFWDNGAVGLSMDFANQNFIVKDGTLQSKPFSDIVNFSRTSNATVTNSAGVITYAPHNLLTSSDQFNSSAWTKSGLSVTANSIVAPDGTTTADTLTSTTSTAGSTGIYQSATFPAGSTLTFYAKAGTANFIGATFGGVGCYANFNLGTGAVASSTGCTPSIVSVGNGWYRCVIANSAINGTLPIITGKDANPSASPWTNGVWTSGNTVYLWGAQLEIGSTATTYNSTTVKNLLGYSELFDNAAWTKSNSFVQTNLLKYSEDFSVSASWNASSGITSNTTIAPNGYQTADTIDVSLAIPFQVLTCTASTVYTYSAYIQLGTLAAADFKFAVRNDTAGTFIAQDIVPTETLTTGSWTRITYTFTTPVGCVTVRPYLYRNNASPTGTFYAWGAQLVQGSVAGDYRRTDAAALPIYYANHNGVVCAEKLVENTATNSHYTNQNTTVVSGTRYTYSVYAKAGERNWLAIYLINTVNADNTFFNLSTGVIGNTQAGATASMIAVGNGWYRCSVSAVTTSTTSGIYPGIASANGTVSYTGNGTSGIYIFGAQLSDSASLDPYVLNAATAPSAAAYYGARFDYDPVTLAPKGLLIEEQRANLLLNSSLAGTNLATQNVTVTAVAHTLSFYGTGQIVLSGTSSATVVGDGAYPTRKTLTFTPTAGTLTLTVTGTVQYAQLEIGSFATSFIPTAASQVTRTADVASIQGSNFYSWYRTDEGAFVADWQGGRASGGNDFRVGAIGANNSTTNFWIALNGDGLSMTTWFGGAAPLYSFTSPNFVTVGGKMGVSYSVAGILQAAGGTVDANDTSISTMPLVTEINLGARATTRINGTIKSLSYFPTRLNNDTLKGLTA